MNNSYVLVDDLTDQIKGKAIAMRDKIVAKLFDEMNNNSRAGKLCFGSFRFEWTHDMPKKEIKNEK